MTTSGSTPMSLQPTAVWSRFATPGAAGETVVKVLIERDGRRILCAGGARGNHGLSATGGLARFVHRRRGLHASTLGRDIRRRGSPTRNP